MGNIFRKKYKKIKALEDISDFSSDDENDSENDENKGKVKVKIKSKKVKAKTGVNKIKVIPQKPSYICKRCHREFFLSANLDQHFWCQNKK